MFIPLYLFICLFALPVLGLWVLRVFGTVRCLRFLSSSPLLGKNCSQYTWQPVQISSLWPEALHPSVLRVSQFAGIAHLCEELKDHLDCVIIFNCGQTSVF